ncbi:hypothetical protein K461DRAFT_278535 [Myriangium duriaei CBS 260.36]|uniref:Uncharacterized protein n=1 Tax=Myriangium duriaei CBS 260.36 TaxID=1168546 RepID=A0A9P4J0U5_9PEZI|nr:hypothetical protein K461DRAFT_278535 [Myriangium duriaei CBS 260.36]
MASRADSTSTSRPACLLPSIHEAKHAVDLLLRACHRPESAKSTNMSDVSLQDHPIKPFAPIYNPRPSRPVFVRQ